MIRDYTPNRDRHFLRSQRTRKSWTIWLMNVKKTHFVQELNVDDTKHKDELVEDEIPEFILEVLDMWEKRHVY